VECSAGTTSVGYNISSKITNSKLTFSFIASTAGETSIIVKVNNLVIPILAKQSIRIVDLQLPPMVVIEPAKESPDVMFETYCQILGSSFLPLREINQDFAMETRILRLLVDYLEQTVVTPYKLDLRPGVFYISDDKGLSTVTQILSSWLTLRKAVAALGASEVRSLAKDLAQSANALKPGESILVPTGCKGVSMMAVIEPVGTDKILWTQFSHNSAYHQYLGYENIMKQSLTLEISDIPVANVSEDLLFQVLAMQQEKRKYSNLLYDVILPKLGGKLQLNANAETMTPRDLDRFQAVGGLSPIWTMVRGLFSFLVNRYCESSDTSLLCKKLVFNFIYHISECVFKLAGDSPEWQYLLNEIPCQLAHELKGFRNSGIFSGKNGVIEEMTISQQVEKMLNLLHKNPSESRVPDIAHPLKPFDPIFFTKNPVWTLNGKSSSKYGIKEEIIHDRIPFPTLPGDLCGKFQVFHDKFLNSLKGRPEALPVAVQISQGIEDFMLSILRRHSTFDLSYWCNRETLSDTNWDTICEIIFEMIRLHHAAYMYMAYAQRNAEHLPYQFSLALVVSFAGCAMIDALVRKHPRFAGAYQPLCISIPSSKFQEQLQCTVFIESNWRTLAVSVLQYWQAKSALSQFPSSQISNYSGNDQNIVFCEKFADKRLPLKPAHKHKQWANLMWSFSYLPRTLILLRECGTYARRAIIGADHHVMQSKPRLDLLYKSTFSIDEDNSYSRFSWAKTPSYYRALRQGAFFLGPSSEPYTWDKYNFPTYTQECWQRLIFNVDTKVQVQRYTSSYINENSLIASQFYQPTSLTANEYKELGFIRAVPEMKLERLYLAIRDQRLQFEEIEHHFLAFQAMFEMGQEHSFQMAKEQVKTLWIPCLSSYHNYLQNHKSRYRALGALMEMVCYLSSYFMADSGSQSEFWKLLTAIRVTLESHQQDYKALDNNPLAVAELAAYFILSFEPYRERHLVKTPDLPENAVSQLIKNRLLVEQQFSKGFPIPEHLFVRVMRVYYALEDKIFCGVKGDLNKILNPIVKEVLGTWSLNSQWTVDNLGRIRSTASSIDFDIGAGKILSNNIVVGCLPKNVTGHPHFLDVFKGYIPGSKRKMTGSPEELVFDLTMQVGNIIQTYELSVSGSLQATSLLIKIKETDGEWWEFVPSQLFATHLPGYLCNGHRHWLHKETGIIKIWDADNVHKYTLSKNPSSKGSRIIKTADQKLQVVPFHSAPITNTLLWELLSNFESPDNILLFSENGTTISEIRLPRMNLTFKVIPSRDHDTIDSTNFSSFSLSVDQTIPTLAGLSNFLLLEKKPHEELSQSVSESIILIPHQTYKREGNFSSKLIFDQTALCDPPYFAYRLDPVFGRLNGESTAAKLYLGGLYLNSAVPSIDLLYNQHPYRIAFDLFESCWQNVPYIDSEVEILEKILTTKSDNMTMKAHLQQSSTKVTDLVSMAFKLHEARLDWNYNYTVVWLKGVSLLECASKLSFLHIKEETQHQVERNNNLLQYLLDAYAPAYLVHYFFSLDLVDPGCRLTKNEEISLLKAVSLKFQKFNSIWYPHLKDQIENYVHYLDNPLNSAIQYTSPPSLNITTVQKLVDPESLCKVDFQNLNNHFSSRIYSRASNIKNDSMAQWIKQTSFDTEKFLSLYQLLKTDNSLSMWEKEVLILSEIACSHSPSLLHYHSHYSRDSHFQFTQVLYIVLFYPKEFPTLPDFFALGKSWFKYSKTDSDPDRLKEGKKMRILCKIIKKIGKLCNQYKDKVPSISAPAYVLLQKNGIVSQKQNKEIHCFSPTSSIQTYFRKHACVFKKENYFTSVIESPQKFEFPLEKALFSGGYGLEFCSNLEKSWNEFLETKKETYSLKVPLQPLTKQICNVIQNCNEDAQKQWGHIWSIYKYRPTGKLLASSISEYYSQRFSSKTDIISVLMAESKEDCKNPYLTDQAFIEIKKRLRDFLKLQAFITQLILVLDQIEVYKKVAEEEKPHVLQNLATCLLAKRAYNVKEHPSWLLFELENNILIRDKQVNLAKLMAQHEKCRTMFQLNMGEGKSAVIVELLADLLSKPQEVGHKPNLVRITVLDALFAITRKILVEKLGSIWGKRIYTLPFSRSVKISESSLTLLKTELEYCQLYGHILLVTPEHRQCFQLKWEETLLEYMKLAHISNKVDWEKVAKLTRERMWYFSNNLLIPELTDYLVQQEYIDNENNILKFPTNYWEFSREVDKSGKWFTLSLISCVFDELRSQSKQRKKELYQELEAFKAIDQLHIVDCLDESDEILRFGTELNYPIGQRFILDGILPRLSIPQVLLTTLFTNKNICQVLISGQKDGGVILRKEGEKITYIQLLNEEFYENELRPLLWKEFLEIERKELLESNITKYFKSTPPLASWEEELKEFVFQQGRLATKRNEDIIKKLVEDHNTKLLDFILITRGWLGNKILYHVFSYRYSVDYGLDKTPTGELTKKRAAVPYKALNTPAPRSEFGHPDIMIGFTMLSYMYSGLTEDLIFQCLFKLKNEFNDADTQLRVWLNDPEMTFAKLDLGDPSSLLFIYQKLARNSSVIFFFLNQFVFPQEAKQFKKKISANANALVCQPVSVGFSGTDSRNITMPISINSESFDTSTNGKMLHIISREINRNYVMVKYTSSEDLLDNLIAYVKKCYSSRGKKKQACVLIESGALITGLRNIEVVRYLSQKLSHIFDGFVFFDDVSGDISVFVVATNEQILMSTCRIPKDKLFTYFDDSHTRGSDIKLPLRAHAVVTIGREMNKDKYMQAVMRLRQLNDAQSIVTWGQEGITTEIGKKLNIAIDKINSRSVLTWITLNTVEKLKKDVYPLCKQDLRFIYKNRALYYQKQIEIPCRDLISRCKERVSYKLTEYYGTEVRTVTLATHDLKDNDGGFFDGRMKQVAFDAGITWDAHLAEADFKMIQQLKKKPKKMYTIMESIMLAEGDLEQDQEKEVEVEVIQQTQIRLPEQQQPAAHNRWHYAEFYNIQHGKYPEYPGLNLLNSAYANVVNVIPEFKNCRFEFNWDGFSLTLMYTKNFASTIIADTDYDDYLRPVDCILLRRDVSGKQTDLILLSGTEGGCIKQQLISSPRADCFLLHVSDIIQNSTLQLSSFAKKVQLHPAEITGIALIKLFNGETKFSPAVKDLLCVPLCKITETRMAKHFGDASSKLIFKGLVDMGYLTNNGFCTVRLNNHFKKGTFDFPTQQDKQPSTSSPGAVQQAILTNWTSIESFLQLAVDVSWFSPENANLHKSSEICLNLLSLRGKMNEYKASPLYELLNY
jgi:hypothetical protein